MTNVTPIQQPPVEDLKNALTIAEMGRDGYLGITVRPEEDAPRAFGDIARLLRDALEKLGEPNPMAIQQARVLIRCLPAFGYLEAPDITEREARDIAATVLVCQLRGSPDLDIPTWSKP